MNRFFAGIRRGWRLWASALLLLGLFSLYVVTRDSGQGVPTAGDRPDGFTVPAGETREIEGVVTVRGDVVVEGILVMRPGSELRFESDDPGVGLWVRGDGVLDLRGSEKPPWRLDGREVVADLERDVVIRGGHTHITSSRPQSIRYVAFIGGGQADVLGRYPLHFHLMGDGSRGSIVEGAVCISCRNHAFVPHGSHGITFKDLVAVDTWGSAFWWDRGDSTNEVMWDHLLAVDTKTADGGQCPFGDKCQDGDFLLGRGENMTVRDSASVKSQLGQGFFWPSQANRIGGSSDKPNTWVFERNTVVSGVGGGISTWQNDIGEHVIRDSLVVGANLGVWHGAYVNGYQFFDVEIVADEVGIRQNARSGDDPRIMFQRVKVTAPIAVEFGEHVADTSVPSLFLDSELNGRIVVDDKGTRTLADFVDSGVNPGAIEFADSACSCSLIRVQNGDRAWRVTKAGAEQIDPFFDGPSS